MDAKQKELASRCVELEKQIWEVFSNPPRFPICNDDWTDAHQTYLEYKEFKEEIDAIYMEAQKELIEYLKSIGKPVTLKVKTAREYYNKQKDFEELCEFYRKHHINGM